MKILKCQLSVNLYTQICYTRYVDCKHGNARDSLQNLTRCSIGALDTEPRCSQCGRRTNFAYVPLQSMLYKKVDSVAEEYRAQAIFERSKGSREVAHEYRRAMIQA